MVEARYWVGACVSCCVGDVGVGADFGSVGIDVDTGVVVGGGAEGIAVVDDARSDAGSEFAEGFHGFDFAVSFSLCHLESSAHLRFHHPSAWTVEEEA